MPNSLDWTPTFPAALPWFARGIQQLNILLARWRWARSSHGRSWFHYIDPSLRRCLDATIEHSSRHLSSIPQSFTYDECCPEDTYPNQIVQQGQLLQKALVNDAAVSSRSVLSFLLPAGLPWLGQWQTRGDFSPQQIQKTFGINSSLSSREIHDADFKSGREAVTHGCTLNGDSLLCAVKQDVVYFFLPACSLDSGF